MPDGPLIAFAGGGTGGHLYPAIAIAEAIRRRVPDARFVIFGTQRPIDDRILSGVGCDIVRQVLPALSPIPWRWPSIYLGLRRSASRCRRRFESDPPVVVIGTGGMASVPAVREAHRMGIPTAILNPDALPGRANRHLAGIADVVFAQWDDTVQHYPPGTDVRVLGCPIRPGFNTVGPASVPDARQQRSQKSARFSLQPDRKTLLVTGASQGARSINEAVIANLDLLESLPDWQVLHLTGEKDHADTAAAYRDRSLAAAVIPYTDQMADALSIADLVISRAGASTLAEITAMGRASILMPYPYHRDQHQLANAKCLARASAARIVRDAIDSRRDRGSTRPRLDATEARRDRGGSVETARRRDGEAVLNGRGRGGLGAINGPALRSVLGELLTDDAVRDAMSAAARRIGRGNSAADIAKQVLCLGEKPGVDGAPDSVEATC